MAVNLCSSISMISSANHSARKTIYGMYFYIQDLFPIVEIFLQKDMKQTACD